jgi:hypothetical protein
MVGSRVRMPLGLIFRQRNPTKIVIKLCRTMEKFKYLGTAITNQNHIREEMNTLNSGNACCRLFQNILFSCLTSKNAEFKILCCFVWV